MNGLRRAKITCAAAITKLWKRPVNALPQPFDEGGVLVAQPASHEGPAAGLAGAESNRPCAARCWCCMACICCRRRDCCAAAAAVARASWDCMPVTRASKLPSCCCMLFNCDCKRERSSAAAAVARAS